MGFGGNNNANPTLRMLDNPKNVLKYSKEFETFFGLFSFNTLLQSQSKKFTL